VIKDRYNRDRLKTWCLCEISVCAIKNTNNDKARNTHL